jgi:hypothetical protein
MEKSGNSEKSTTTQKPTDSTPNARHPQIGKGLLQLVNKHKAAEILGVSPETLKKYRLQKDSTLIKGIHYYIWNPRVVKYNAALIADWGVNRDNPEAHQRTIEAFLASLPSNQPKKRGRRVG